MIQNSLLHENMRILKEQYPAFHDVLISPAFSNPNLSISEITQPNNFMLQSGQTRCFLHSTFNIDREMQELFKPLPDDDNQVILIFGLGYGHCLDYLKKKRIKYKKVLVFEPYNNIMLEVLKKRPLKELFGRPNIFVNVSKIANDIAAMILQEVLGAKNVKLLFHISYMTIYKELYDNILRTFRSEKNSVNTSIATFSHFSTEWNRNQLKSLRRNDADIMAILGKFNGIPGIVASAGPSLDKHFNLLQQVNDKAVIIAPGTSSKIFNKIGLNAHISMSIDASEGQADFFENFHLNSILVGSYRLHSNVYSNFPNLVTRVMLSSEFLAQYCKEWLGEKSYCINDHASVSSSAVDLLVAMGCNPIILLGQDLCYHQERVYAGEGNDEAVEEDLKNIPRIEDIDIYGNKVYTDRGFKSMQNDMECLNNKYSDIKIKIYNATEGGLNIHGIENIQFQSIFETAVQNRPSDVKNILDDSLTRSITVHNEENDKTIFDFFKHILAECEKAEKIIEEKEANFSRLEKLKAKNAQKNRLNNEMFYIKGFNKQLEEIPFYKKVLFPNVQAQLTYYKASSSHISDSGEDYEGAELYERKLDEFIIDFSNRLKALVLSEMVVEENA